MEKHNEKLTFVNKRTWHYFYFPKKYEIRCDKCKGQEIAWSEYEGMIWCYRCKIDTPGDKGIFDGPIPWETTKLIIGPYCFHKYDMVRNCILEPYRTSVSGLNWIRIVLNSIAVCKRLGTFTESEFLDLLTKEHATEEEKRAVVEIINDQDIERVDIQQLTNAHCYLHKRGYIARSKFAEQLNKIGLSNFEILELLNKNNEIPYNMHE